MNKYGQNPKENDVNDVFRTCNIQINEGINKITIITKLNLQFTHFNKIMS